MRAGSSGTCIRRTLVIVTLATINVILVTFNLGRYLNSVASVSQGEGRKGERGEGRGQDTSTSLPYSTRPQIPPHDATRRMLIHTSCPAEYSRDLDVIRSYDLFQFTEQKSFYNSSESHNFTEKILILTPISNAGNHLDNYFKNLCSLSYPHELISVSLGEDSSTDRTLHVASRYAGALRNYFRDIAVHKLSETIGSRRHNRHDREFQLARRQHLALARNELLSRSLADHDWVLWMDSDVRYVPRDLIQHLLSARKEIVVPSCMYFLADGTLSLYDRNTWRETNVSRAFLAGQDRDFLMLEGYSPSSRRYLPDLQGEGTLVPVDGVGGCVLLVRSDCHKKGLIFPPFVLDNHIETEGLAKMAARMGYKPHGFTRLNVVHY